MFMQNAQPFPRSANPAASSKATDTGAAERFDVETSQRAERARQRVHCWHYRFSWWRERPEKPHGHIFNT